MNKVTLMYPKSIMAVFIAGLLLISSANVLHSADPDKWDDIAAYYDNLLSKRGCKRAISLGNDTVWVELRQQDYYWIYNYNPSSKFEVHAYSTVDLAAFSLGFAMNKRIANIDTAYLSTDFSDFSHTVARYANDAVLCCEDTISYVFFGAVDTLLNYIEARDTFYIGTCEFSIREDMMEWLVDKWVLFWFDSASIPPGGDFIFVSWNGASLTPTISKNDTLTVLKGGAVVDMEVNRIPEEFELKQNYPNPFNPTTTIEFSVKSQSFVQLDIYNLLGRKVQTLVNEYLEPGCKLVEWNGLNANGRKVASGVYLYQLRIGDFVETKKMILLK